MKSNYYLKGEAAKTLPFRLKVIENLVPKGSTVLDIGCIDGTISNMLIQKGIATHVTGIDIEDKFYEQKYENFNFIKGDVCNMDLEGLQVDVILFLNILHHIMTEKDSPTFGKELFDKFMSKCNMMIFDMGSMTEKPINVWSEFLKRNFKNDADVQRFLFEGYKAKFALKYQQFGGYRTVWKVCHEQ
jgi:2-polyprenyl-3-methyl-5-hydroxy-6-metoxy-1,4-benzoquinol methylase